MDFIHSVLEKLNLETKHATHLGAFVLGVFLTFGMVALDGQLNTSEYRKSGAASVLKPINEIRTERTNALQEKSTTTDNIALEDSEESEDVLPEEDKEDEGDVSESNYSEPAPEPEPEPAETTPSQSEVEMALQQAQALLEELSESQSDSNGSDEEAVFTTPSGLKIDADGNVINGDGSTTPPPTTTTDPNTVVLPDGVYRLPSGQLVYADGTIYKESTDPSTTYVQPSPTSNYLTSPTGAIFDAQGRLISLPPKEEKELIPPTVIDTNNLPEEGSIIYIPLEVKFWSSNNSQLECSMNFYGNNIELCELYRTDRYTYDWITVETE